MELVSVSESFAKTRLKYLDSLNDFGEKLMFYQAFVFLLPPFYMDERGQAKRAMMRDILSIDEAEESELVSHLKRTGRLKVINGGLMVLVSADDAKVALEELWMSKADAMSTLIDGFLGI